MVNIDFLGSEDTYLPCLTQGDGDKIFDTTTEVLQDEDEREGDLIDPIKYRMCDIIPSPSPTTDPTTDPTGLPTTNPTTDPTADNS